MKKYTGEALKDAQKDYDLQGNIIDGKWIQPYKPSEGLVKALEYARILERPLLLRGEPGSGKTKFAQAIAFELYGKEYKKYYFEWYVKSTEKAKDGLYTYDHLGRLQNIQDHTEAIKKQKEFYWKPGPLGKAFESDKNAILLIDEIDKADIDFPNDLLLELDQGRFFVNELDKKEVIAKNKPIVIITSNDERELPNAFLRRCIFHYISFDEPHNDKIEETLRHKRWVEIVESHLKANLDSDKFLLGKSEIKVIVSKFIELVDKMSAGSALKKPDTSELLDWVKIIHQFWVNDKKIEDQIIENGKLLHPEVLIKNIEDLKRFIQSPK